MRVGLFVTCLVDAMRPSIGFAALKLLEGAGCEVVVPATQTCCGQPAFNSGDAAVARSLARKLIAEFEAFDYVVVPSGSCGGMIKAQCPQLLRDDPDMLPRAEALAARTFELTDFLASVLALDAVPGDFAGTITYHDSCSGLRELGVKAQPRALLARMPGVVLTEMASSEECCGFGGSFATSFGDISAQIAERKCRNIQAAGTDAVIHRRCRLHAQH